MSDFSTLYPNQNYPIRKLWKLFFLKSVPLFDQEIKDKDCKILLKNCQEELNEINESDSIPNGKRTSQLNL